MFFKLSLQLKEKFVQKNNGLGNEEAGKCGLELNWI